MLDLWEKINYMVAAITLTMVACYLFVKGLQRYPWHCLAGIGFLLMIYFLARHSYEKDGEFSWGWSFYSILKKIPFLGEFLSLIENIGKSESK